MSANSLLTLLHNCTRCQIVIFNKKKYLELKGKKRVSQNIFIFSLLTDNLLCKSQWCLAQNTLLQKNLVLHQCVEMFGLSLPGLRKESQCDPSLDIWPKIDYLECLRLFIRQTATKIACVKAKKKTDSGMCPFLSWAEAASVIIIFCSEI